MFGSVSSLLQYSLSSAYYIFDSYLFLLRLGIQHFATRIIQHYSAFATFSAFCDSEFDSIDGAFLRLRFPGRCLSGSRYS